MSGTKYHYTIEGKVSLILDSGGLIPTGSALAPREKQVLWFSGNKLYEPTCIKPIIKAGQIEYPNWQTYQSLFKLFRFKLISKRHLSGWQSTCKQAKTPAKIRRKMEQAGRAQKGKPEQWFGTLDAVPLAELQVQVWRDQKWVDADLAGIDKPRPLPDHQQFVNFTDASKQATATPTHPPRRQAHTPTTHRVLNRARSKHA